MQFNLILVDDNPDSIFLHKILIAKSGFNQNPITCGGGQEIIDYISREVKDKIGNTLIFLDLFMPKTDGWAVLDYLETVKKFEKIKVILISSSVNMGDKIKAMKYKSVIEYIEKPLLLEYLINLKSQNIF